MYTSHQVTSSCYWHRLRNFKKQISTRWTQSELDIYGLMINYINILFSVTNDKYEAGIEQLQSAAVVVAETEEQLKRLQPDLLATSNETAELLNTVEKQSAELDTRKKVIIIISFII